MLTDQLGFFMDPRLSVELANLRLFFILGWVGKGGSSPGGDRRRLHLADLEKSITIQRFGAAKEGAVTEDAPVYPGDIIYVPERFLKRGAGLPASVRHLYGRIHNNIRRDYA
jgi:hypothetical protein